MDFTVLKTDFIRWGRKVRNRVLEVVCRVIAKHNVPPTRPRFSMLSARWLGKGWYDIESEGTTQWIWSRDIAEIRTVGVAEVSVSFFTNYSELMGKPQTISIFVDGVLTSSKQYSSGFHQLTLKYPSSEVVLLKIDALRPSDFQGLIDGRFLGIALYAIDVSSSSLFLPEPARVLPNLVPNQPPVMMQIEVTTACHLACIMCSRSKRSGGPSEHMTSEVWDRILEGAVGVEIVNVLGNGEPWTHPKFLDWLRQMDNLGITINITTSGDLINERRAAVLGELLHFGELTFSIDSPDPETYQAIRSQSLDRALAGLRLARAAIDRPDAIRIHAVVMKDTISGLSGFPDLLRRFGVTQLILRGVNYTKPATRDMVPDYTPVERNILLDVKREAEAMGAEVKLLPTLPPELIQTDSGNFKDERSADDIAVDEFEAALTVGIPKTRICYDPWEKAIITREGDVYPCEAYHLQRSLGSLKRETFWSIWTGENYRNFRRQLLMDENLGCRNCERRGRGHHPLNLFAAEIIGAEIIVGEESIVRARNTGSHPWTNKYPVCIGTSRPRDRMSSVFAHDSWIAPNRVATHDERLVACGETATFRFLTRTPPVENIQEFFQFVVEGKCWLPNLEFIISF